MKYFTPIIFVFLISKTYAQNITLDNSFSDDGYSNITIQNINRLTNTVILTNGDFITGYVSTTSSDDYIYLKKTSTNGIVDNAYFGSFHLPGVIKFKKLVQINDKLIVLGSYASSYPYDTNDILVVQFNINGTLDTSFGTNGYERFSYDSTSNDESIDLMNDVLGNSFIYAKYGSNYYLVKIDAVGVIDNSFGSNGTLYLYQYNNLNDPNSIKVFSKVVLQNDGKFLFAGNKKNASTFNWESYLERKLPDGTIDTEFGNNGEIIFSNSEFSTIKNLEYNYDDNSILILHQYDNINFSTDRVFLSKIQISNGNLISTFANNGTTSQYMFSNAPSLNLQYITTLSNSKMLVVGSVSNFSVNPSVNTQLFIMRFNSDGTMDDSTSSNGYYIFNTTPPNSSMRADYVNGLFDLNNGSFVIAYSGSSATSGAYSYLAKFNGSTLGLNNNKEESNYYTIFPNPSENYITIKNKEHSNEQFYFKIVDLTGRLIKQGNSNFNSKIEIKDLTKGGYILSVDTKKGKSFSEKIIIK